MEIRLKDVTLHCQVEGSGPPLILLHGNGEDHTIFREAAEILFRQFTCYLPDSRSHGKSTRVPRLHYDDMARDMVGLMEALELEDVTFFGFSDGGIVGLLAAMQTSRIRTLVVSGANSHPEGVKPGVLRMMKLIYFFTRGDKTRLMLREPHITAPQLAQIQAKTFVLAGEKDLITPEDTAFIAGSIPGAVMRILPGQTHGSHIVHSTEIARILLECIG